MKSATLLLAAVVALAARVPIHCQGLLDADQIPEARQAFEAVPPNPGLRCEITPVHPDLDYSLRFRTGYIVAFPLNQIGGAGHRLEALVRVSPEHGKAVYLASEENLPEVPVTKAPGEFTGTFLVGEGKYNVELLVRDENRRTCYGDWVIQARSQTNERAAYSVMPEGAVQEVALPTGPETGPLSPKRIGRLTILLHAMPRSPNSGKIEDATLRMLQDSLASLLLQLPANAVRLVVFNIDKQAVLLQKDGFVLDDLPQAIAAMEQLEPAVIDVKTLENRDKLDVLSDLVYRELHEPKPADAVILMGPQTASPPDPSLAPARQRPDAPWFYLQFRETPALALLLYEGRTIDAGYNASQPQIQPTSTRPHYNQPSVKEPPDHIALLLHSLQGATYPIDSAHALAAAIRRMSSLIPADEPSLPPAPRTSPPATAATPENVDPAEVLTRLRDRVLEHAAHVPNHVCVETIQRDRFEPIAGRLKRSCDSILAKRARPSRELLLDRTDWLRLDVGMGKNQEIYSWAGAPRFDDSEIQDFVPRGAIGTGPFASMLLSIFQDRDPNYRFVGTTQKGGRQLLEYSFTIPQDFSHYQVMTRGKTWWITGYSGTFQVDPQTADLVRLTVKTDELPESTDSCQVESTLEYGFVSLAGFDYLLPKSTRQRFIGAGGEEAENKITFSACREYRGESTVSFGESAVSGPAASPAASGPAPLRAGMPMAVELAAPVTLRGAAAGDRIEGRLAEPLLDPDSHAAIAPAGARVEGRLMRLTLERAGGSEYQVALRWETLEIAGRPVTLLLKPIRRETAAKDAKDKSRRAPKARDTEIATPLPGEERYGVYRFPARQLAIDSGFRTEWETIAH